MCLAERPSLAPPPVHFGCPERILFCAPLERISGTRDRLLWLPRPGQVQTGAGDQRRELRTVH